MRKELLLKEKNQQLCKSLGDSNFGDVIVVGGGISGIQASLDLATAGFFDVTLAAEVFAIRTELFLETLESGEDLFYESFA